MSTLPSTQTVLDGLGHATLLFAPDGKLLHANLAAGTLLATDLHLIRAQGWAAAAALLDVDVQSPEMALNEVRKRALVSDRPVRFYTLRNGEYIPGSVSALPRDDGEVLTMILLDTADWGVVGSVLNRFHQEMRETVDSTIGHISLITRSLASDTADPATVRIARRLGGFSKLIAMHMKRAARLMQMADRLDNLRTGRTRKRAQDNVTTIPLLEFVENFIQSLDEVELLDPETENHDFRSRIQLSIAPEIKVAACHSYLTIALQELLRNAIMYSLRGTPVRISATTRGQHVQVDIADEGYGIREKDYEQVFGLFQRGRNPQIMSEFGYGLALYLVRHEVTLMNGKLWYHSVENVETIFSLLLPVPSESVSVAS